MGTEQVLLPLFCRLAKLQSKLVFCRDVLKVEYKTCKYKFAEKCRTKTRLLSCINLFSTYFTFTPFQWLVLTIIALSFCLEHKHCYTWKTGKQNPYQLLIFKNQNFVRGFSEVTCIFKFWLFSDWGLADNAKLVHTPKYLLCVFLKGNTVQKKKEN